jgi:hypothetical protein
VTLLTAMASSPPPAIDVAALSRAIRFALVCILLGFCYVNIRCAFGLTAPSFVFKATLNGRPLPEMTVFVLQYRILFTSLSVILPFCAALTLFSSQLIRSFYALGLLTLLTFVELATLSCALLSLSGLFIQSLGANPGP